MPGNFFDQFDDTPEAGPLRAMIPSAPKEPTPAGPFDADKNARDAERLALERRRLALSEEAGAREANKASPQISDDDKLGIRQDMRKKIADIDRLKKMSKEDFFASGFGAKTMADWFPASSAGRVRAGVLPIGAIGALGKVLEMSKANGGKNPLTPLSNADLVLMEKSIDNLDPTQNDTDFQRNLDTYRDLFLRLFKGAGGATDRTPARSGKSPRVINFEDLP